MGRVRSQANALARLLDAHPQPVYVVDRQRTIVYCNIACGQVAGLDSTALLGQTCEYRAAVGRGPSEVAAGLCPPPESLAGAVTDREVVLLAPDAGEAVVFQGRFFPLGPDEPVGVLAVLSASDSSRSETGVPTELNAPQLHAMLGRLQVQMRTDAIRADTLLGISPAVQRVRAQLQLAEAGMPRVVVWGPPGSGRELVARALYARGFPPDGGPIVPLCCPLLDAELVQSTIKTLGRQGNAVGARPGPSLLLLDVDQLPAEAQTELAGFLQLPEFELHTVATATAPLPVRAARGAFRADLAYALSTLVISLPPLRERPEDVPILCQHFVERFNAGGGRQLSGFSPAALDELTTYGWPENVDELSEVVAESCARAKAQRIELADLPPRLRWAADVHAHPRREPETIDLDQLLMKVEHEMIRRALRLAKGNKTRAAALLGITRARLHRRLEPTDPPA